MSLPSSDPSLPTANPTSNSGTRTTRPQNSAWNSSRQTSRRGLTPISTASSGQTRAPSSSDSPLRAAFSPTSSGFSLNHAAAAANRQVTSRQSSTSSTNSLASPAGSGHASAQLHSGNRSRAVTSTGSPRLASSLASLSSPPQAGGSASGSVAGGSRLARHSPSLSLSTTASPVSSTGPHSAGGSGQLTSILVTQLHILLSTLKESNFDTQADKIRSIVDENGMEVFTTLFRRLLQSNASTIFPGSARAQATADAAGQYRLLADEMAKVSRDPLQAEKIAQSLDTNDGELFRDFDLSTFIDHFRLNPIAKVALVLPVRTVSKPDLRSKADAILTNNFQPFLHTLSSPPQPNSDLQEDVSPLVLATLIERLIQEPPRNWGEEQRENLNYAIRVRYQRLNARMPQAVESAMFLIDLLESSDSRLARIVQRSGPRSTASLDACKEMLAGVETRDISYPQIANALLFIVMTQVGDPYDPGIFVEGLRQHRAGPKIDWTDVVQGFDRDQLRITKKQFLGLYHALLPLAREYANFDIQTLWGGQWQYAETQLSFVVAFLSTTAQELDVTQIPNLKQAFGLQEFEDASDSIKAFAAEAVKHPLVSREATEVLFTMIFRSQETYNHAQLLGIPDSLINPNMTIFVCAASAVPKPWAALQDQALKQLFYPFLTKHHENYDFVMHALWQHDRMWLAGRMVEFYQQEQMLLVPIFEHAQEHGWIEPLLTIQSSFAVDLATYAHGKGQCNLEEWAQPHISNMGPPQFSRAIQDFLRAKMDDEMNVQRERANPQTPPLTIKTVYLLLIMVGDALQDEECGPIYRQCLQTYPRLFNYGEDENRDALLDRNTEHGHELPAEANAKMEEQYKEMYGGKTAPEQVITELKRLKVSEDSGEQDLFASMLHGLFDEYNCFGEYPNEALATTAVLFGGLLQYNVLSGISEQAAIFMIFEAVSAYGQQDPMYKFGLQAMIHLQNRLKEWPELAERILHIPSLRGTPCIATAENVLKELQEENPGLNGDAVNGVSNGVLSLDDEPAFDTPTPPFSSVHVDPPLRPDLYEDPSEDVSDKVMFVLNNVSKRNLEEKFKDLEGTLEEKHHQWFAHYLVEELAKTQMNFQSLYLQLLESFDKKILWQEVLRETYVSCSKMLNAQSTMDSPTERTNLKNLASWLGSLTLARNQPILHRNISFKDLLIEGHETQRLIVAIPFTCKTLISAGKSKVFKPPNPWLMELLGLLSELYHFFELRLNLKFEIEVLCKDLNFDIKSIEPLDIIRSRPLLHENNMLQQYVQDGGSDGFGDMHLMGLSKRAANERFSPEAVVRALPDLSGMLQIPQAAGHVTQPQLRSIFVNAAQRAIYEIIAPVVERSVTIAAISTAELIQKDFATESDIEKMRTSAYTVVKALSGSLALVTCKEPLRMSITNNIRILASHGLPEQLPEGQIIMFVNDNIDTVCGLVERAAEEHSLAEIDAQLEQAMEERKRHNAERPNESFNNPPVSRWAQLIPEPFRQDPNGLNRQQLALYEDFGRQARIAPAQHANNQSQDANRQLPDMLSETYLPSLTTPAEAPAMPRPTAQTQRMQIMPPPPGQLQVNGYVDTPNIGQRILEELMDLAQAARDAPEEHIEDIAEGAPIRRIFDRLVSLIDGAGVVQKDSLAIAAGQRSFFHILQNSPKRLEIEVFVRLVKQLCTMSVNAGRQLTAELNVMQEDPIFNPGAVTAMISEDLLDLQHVDLLVSRGLKQRRMVVLAFLKDFMDEVLLREHPVALRSDFVLAYEALLQWIAEDPSLELGREIMSKLQEPANQVNGMPSPPQVDKQDQLEYIFDEWIRLQRRETPEHSYLAFVRQLHEQGIIADPEDAASFFRACIEMCCAHFERATGAPWAGQDAPYVQVDALAKLMAYMVVYQSGVDGDGPTSKVAKSLDALIRLMILVMSDYHNKQREHWNGRLYFRLFSSLLCELHAVRQYVTPEQEQEVTQVFGLAFQIVQPRHFPGFTYSWLALLGHRLFVPACLSGNGRTNGGWELFVKLLNTLFYNLGELLSNEEAPVIQDFYRGVIRFLLMLHHDYPEFMVENHLQLGSSMPVFCHQLINIVNSAVPRTIINDQPDPFAVGLKINRLEKVRQAPLIFPDLNKFLDDAGLREPIERIVVNSELTDDNFATVLSTLEGAQSQNCRFWLNIMVLYIGHHATATGPAFSSAAVPARLLDRLLREISKDEVRYHLVCAMINQVRYVNSHTHYFATALQHFFTSGTDEIQQTIMRVIAERLGAPRPHPWGLIVMVLELLKNPSVDLFSLPWMRTAPQVEQMLLSLAHSQERMGRSPMGAMT